MFTIVQMPYLVILGVEVVCQKKDTDIQFYLLRIDSATKLSSFSLEAWSNAKDFDSL